MRSRTKTLRLRRSAAQLHALAQVEREIRATDPNGRRKYLQDFSLAFRTYESVLSPEQLQGTLLGADVLLVGDYHALPASQRYAAKIVSALAGNQREVVLGVESIFSRDQHILEQWQSGAINERELRHQIRFDLDWGYPWEPFYELLRAARSHGVQVFGLDCMPRNDLRRISTRDRHAAAKIAQLRRQFPKARIVVLFGESHLAPNHLPELLREGLPHDRIVTVLQNVDPLYWRAAGERHEHVEAVEVGRNVVCVFNATPLEKYESYRLCLDHWSQDRPCGPDFSPTVYNLIEGLAKFLHVKTGTHQDSALVEQFPDVCCRPEPKLTRWLRRKITTEAERRAFLARLDEYGAAYVPAMNSIVVRDFHMMHVAEEASLFLHHACRGALVKSDEASGTLQPEDNFYLRALENALGYFGSRLLYPARPAVREADLYALYAQSQEEVEEHTIYSYAEYMRLLDFLVMHKDYEANARCYVRPPALIEENIISTGAKFEYLTRRLGYMLGSELYDAYISGRISRRFLRSLFFRKLDRPRIAHDTYITVAQRVRGRKRGDAVPGQAGLSRSAQKKSACIFDRVRPSSH